MHYSWILSVRSMDPESANKFLLAIGSSWFDKPKTLLLGLLKGGIVKKYPFIKYLIQMLSSFSIKPTSIDELGFLDLVRIMYRCGSTVITPYRFQIAIVKQKSDEHTKPMVVKSVHMRLTIPIDLLEEPTKALYEIIAKHYQSGWKNDLFNFALASAIAGLLTAPTRNGYMVRLTLMCTELLIAYNMLLKGENELSDHIVRMLALLVYDTVKWYAKHLQCLGEPDVAEFTHMIYDPSRLLSLSDKITWETTVEDALRDALAPAIHEREQHKLSKSLNRLLSSNNQVVRGLFKLLFGRIHGLVKETMKLDGCEKLVVMATEQWNPLQLVLLREVTSANEIIVLYTPSILYQRLYEEMFRETVGKYLDKYPTNVKHIPISSTDTFYMKVLAKKLVEKYGNALYVLQGPALPSTLLYWELKQYNIDKIVFI